MGVRQTGVNAGIDKGVENKDKGITPNVGSSEDEDSSTTKSAISEDTIEIRDEENQKQDINDLSRDTENANNPLKPIFDKDKILEKEQAAALFGEMGFELVGDLIEKNKWAKDDPRAIALHGLIGGIMPEINGGDFGEGMTVGALNKLLISKLTEAGLSGAELEWASALLGGAISGSQGAGIGR